eukprot:s425_g21.t1
MKGEDMAGDVSSAQGFCGLVFHSPFIDSPLVHLAWFVHVLAPSHPVRPGPVTRREAEREALGCGERKGEGTDRGSAALPLRPSLSTERPASRGDGGRWSVEGSARPLAHSTSHRLRRVVTVRRAPSASSRNRRHRPSSPPFVRVSPPYAHYTRFTRLHPSSVSDSERYVRRRVRWTGWGRE